LGAPTEIRAHMTENRKVEPCKPLIFRPTTFTYGLKNTALRQSCHAPRGTTSHVHVDRGTEISKAAVWTASWRLVSTDLKHDQIEQGPEVSPPWLRHRVSPSKREAMTFFIRGSTVVYLLFPLNPMGCGNFQGHSWETRAKRFEMRAQGASRSALVWGCRPSQGLPKLPRAA
jgi:hypothetical protein